MTEEIKLYVETSPEAEDVSVEAKRPIFRKGDERDFLDAFYRPDADKPEQADEDMTISVEERIIRKIQSIYDPEIPVNIYDLGLIYSVEVNDEGFAYINMTLTTPHCPVAETMPDEVATRVREVTGVSDVKIELVWDPPWDPSMMTEVARLELGLL